MSTGLRVHLQLSRNIRKSILTLANNKCADQSTYMRPFQSASVLQKQNIPNTHFVKIQDVSPYSLASILSGPKYGDIFFWCYWSMVKN